MVSHDDKTGLSSVHRQLLDALACLDRTGLHVAAAHLATAIELVEDDLGLEPGQRRAGNADNPVAVVARAMVDVFGDRAQSVARRQLAEASGSAVLAWAAILTMVCQAS
jgi:hypothetical protein